MKRFSSRFLSACTRAVFVVACLVPSTVRADQLFLTNGDTLTATVASAAADEVVFNTALAGRVTVRWTAIARFTSTTTITLSVERQGTIDGRLKITDGRVSLQRSDGTTTVIPPGAVRNIERPRTSAGQTSWEGTLSADVALSHGNAETETVATNGTLTRLGRSDKVGIFGTYLFSTVGVGASATTTARATRSGARYDHDILGPLFGLAFGDVENDPLQLLDLRTVFGGGAGLHVTKTAGTQLNVIAGASYARDRYAGEQVTSGSTKGTPPGQGGTAPGKGGTPPGRGGTPPSVVRTSLSRDIGELLVGQDLTHQLSDGFTVTENARFFSAMGASDDYRVSFDLSLTAQLNGWLQWNLTLADRYLHIPPAGGAVQNDAFISSGLGIAFGRGNAGSYTGADGPGRGAAPPRR